MSAKIASALAVSALRRGTPNVAYTVKEASTGRTLVVEVREVRNTWEHKGERIDSVSPTGSGDTCHCCGGSGRAG